MFEFLLAANLAATIWLIAEATPATLGQWLTGALPAWMQGVGTIAAAMVGYWALTAWKDQEQSRRQADAAARLSSATARVVFTMRACRPAQAIGLGTANLDRAVHRVVKRELKGHFDRLTRELLPCQFEIVATEAFLPREMSKKAVEICAMAVDLREAWEGVVYASKDNISANDGASQRTLIESCLAKLGVIVEAEADDGLSKAPKVDVFDRLLMQRYKTLTDGLREILTLSTRAPEK